MAFGHHEIPARGTDIEDDAQDGVMMSQADAARDYWKSLRISRQLRDETLQNPCPPPLSTITCTSTAPYLGGSTAGKITSSKQTSSSRKPTSEGAGGSRMASVQQTSSRTTTTAGGIWAQRRRERLENGKEFLRKLLGFADEDDEGDVPQDWL